MRFREGRNAIMLAAAIAVMPALQMAAQQRYCPDPAHEP